MNLPAVGIIACLAVTAPLAASPRGGQPEPARNRFDDPEYVLHMALNDPDPDRRRLAATVLRSQPHLVRLMESPEAEIRLRAVGALTDARALAHAVLRDPDLLVRRLAVIRTVEPGILRKAALEDRDEKVRAS